MPLLDLELIAKHPTALMGFSDTTVLNLALWVGAGLITFNGPALLTDFAEYPEMLGYSRDCFQRVLCRAEPAGKIEPAAFWTEEFLDWSRGEDLERPRHLLPSPGWSWLKPGQAEGTLVGGCLESLQHLRGTRFWPSWDGAIFFFETSELKPSPETVDALLMDYENMGVFERLSGMLVGRPMSYSDEEKATLREVLLERTRAYDFPIVCDMDFGHTAPQCTLPLGCRARIDTERQVFELLDAAVS